MRSFTLVFILHSLSLHSFNQINLNSESSTCRQSLFAIEWVSREAEKVEVAYKKRGKYKEQRQDTVKKNEKGYIPLVPIPDDQSSVA